MGGNLSLVIRLLSRDKQQNKSSSVISSQGIMELMKPKYLKNNKKRQLMEPVPVSEWTLKDWLLASPAGASRSLMRPQECFKEEELYVFKQSCKRVHPSSASASARILSEASSIEVSSMSRSQSGKLKKRVSFKLPEEADMILFYSPRGTIESH